MGWFSKPKEEPKGNKIVLKIQGMTCGHCQARVETALKNLRGVNSAKVDLRKNIAEVYYDKNLVNFEQMKKVVEETEIYKVVGSV